MIARIPVLTDGVVTLRAPVEEDVQGSIEQCQDPVSRRWTTVPTPYTRDDARTYLRHVIADGWASDREWAFVVAARDETGVERFCGTVSLRNLGDRRAEVAFGAHPWARGRGIMERSLRLLLDWGFAQRDLLSIMWLARRGNWPSRRLAWRLGFTVEGTLRDWLAAGEGLTEAWAGTLRRGEERSPRSPWLETPTLRGDGLVLRRLAEGDLPRVVEARNDPELQRWLQRPRDEAPHTVAGHARFLDARHEDAASGSAVHWAVADPGTDRYLGQVSLFGVHHRREAELAYWAHPDARGRGITTRACRLVVRHCFVPFEDGGLGLRRLTADAAEGNAASQHVLEACGFVHVGRQRQSTLLDDGRWVDSLTYDQLAEEHGADLR